LKELQEKKYAFRDLDLLGMLDDLLEKGITELPPPKHLKEATKTNDPKYYWYHSIISHLLQ